jgi:hypothetical protein
MSQPYTSRFFAHYKDGAHRSAMVILPIVFKHAAIKSIVDFGCGTGAPGFAVPLILAYPTFKDSMANGS